MATGTRCEISQNAQGFCIVGSGSPDRECWNEQAADGGVSTIAGIFLGMVGQFAIVVEYAWISFVYNTTQDKTLCHIFV